MLSRSVAAISQSIIRPNNVFPGFINFIVKKPAVIFNGKAFAQSVQHEIKEHIYRIQRMTTHTHFRPGLAVVQVGDRGDSNSYIRMKEKAAHEAGFAFFHHRFDADIPESELLDHIKIMNSDKRVHGLIVQLPLPPHLCKLAICSQIDPSKDADGFHTDNLARIFVSHDKYSGGNSHLNRSQNIPCTPKGILLILHHYFKEHEPSRVNLSAAPELVEIIHRSSIIARSSCIEGEIDLSGKTAVVIGRSYIVGRPISALLERCNATVVLCHSKTNRNQLQKMVEIADILVVAAGSPQLVAGEWIKEGAIVLDVGINAISDPTKKLGYRLVGDVDFDVAKLRAGFITPVPGGIGPVTVAMLLKNTFENALMSIN